MPYIVAATLFFLFLLGACGSDDTKPPEPTTVPPTSAPATTASAPTRSDTADAPPVIETPEDDGIVHLPHDEGAHLTPIEWWYFNGHLDTEDGRTFSYHFVTFQSMLASGLTPRLMQLSWADHDKGIHLVERAGRLSPGRSDFGGV